MSKAKNKVVAGDYTGNVISSSVSGPFISVGLFKSIDLNKKNVQQYELITDEHIKSAASGVARGLIGGALLGPVGMLAGGISAKSNGIYHVSILFNDGKKSLIEIDDKIYKSLIKTLF